MRPTAELIAGLYSCAEQLYELIDAEAAAIIESDALALEHFAESKRQLFVELESLEQQRRLNFPTPADFEAALANDSGLLQRWQELTKLLGLCQRSNLINGQILHKRAETTLRTLEILTGRSTQGVTYDANGRTGTDTATSLVNSPRATA